MMRRLRRSRALRLSEVGSAPPPHSRFPRPGGGGAPHALVKPRRCERLRRVGSARDAQRRHRWVQTARHGWSGGPSPRPNIAEGNLLHAVVIVRRHRAPCSSKSCTHKPAPRPRASRREPRVPKSQRPGLQGQTRTSSPQQRRVRETPRRAKEQSATPAVQHRAPAPDAARRKLLHGRGASVGTTVAAARSPALQRTVPRDPRPGPAPRLCRGT